MRKTEPTLQPSLFDLDNGQPPAPPLDNAKPSATESNAVPARPTASLFDHPEQGVAAKNSQAAPAMSIAATEAAAVEDNPQFPVPPLPASWLAVLKDEFRAPYFLKLQEFVADERQKHKVFPPEGEVYTALQTTPYENVNVFLLGQDPYHNPGQAHGLCFSVRPGVQPPPSLANIFQELKNDLGCRVPNNGYLMPWAEQGILMLNAVLTVRANQPNSHKDHGWEIFTDAVIREVNAKPDPVVFVLWGAYARKKAALIDTSRHAIVQSAHPSPFSASSGFFGSRPFSKINGYLRSWGKPEIGWQIPDL